MRPPAGHEHPVASGAPQPPSAGLTLATAALSALGVTAIATQIVLLREFLSIFYGNELVIGIVLANWLLLTGLGSFLGRLAEGRETSDRPAICSLIGLGLLPPLTVALLRGLRNEVFIPGSMIGITQASLSSLVLLAPFCLLSGFSFALFAAALSERLKANAISLAYVWESLGSALGGAAFSLLLIPRLDTFQALTITVFLNLTLAAMKARASCHPRIAALALALIVAAALTIGLAAPDTLTRRLLFPGQEVVAFRDTPYGNLTVTRQGDQLNFFENTVLMASTNDVAAAEEAVHYAMVQHPKPRHVLLVGGGIAGTPHEVLRYGVASVDYTEINPWLIDLAQTFTKALSDQKIQVIPDDARRHVRRTDRRYDVALINLPDPETAQLNRYFTVEFFRELKRVLHSGAVISLSLLPATEYQGAEARLLSSSLQATLKQVFTNVLIVPGGRNYFLASDGPLAIHIGRLIEERGLETVYVNQYYLDDRILETRSREITAALANNAPVNTDFAPVCYFQQLAYWLSSLGISSGPWLFLGLAALLMAGWRFSTIGLGIFTGGFCASSLEMVLLIAFQALYGSLYQMTGIVVTSFMAGLAAGSWSVRHFAGKAHIGSFISLQLLVAAAGVVLALALPRLQADDHAPAAIHLLFTAMSFVAAALIGMEFAVASLIRRGTAASVAGELYGLDLAGSAVGALTVTVYAIPRLGLTGVSLLVGAVSALSAGICLIGRGGYRIGAGGK